MEKIIRHPLFLFLRVMLKHPMSVSALAPSSQELARVMVQDLSLKNDETILELGPGTGALTRQILTILPTSESYLGIEIEETFVRLLNEHFPGLTFVHDTVAQAHIVHTRMCNRPVKIIICGLPISTLQEELQEEIIDNLIRLMRPGSVFRMFQYVHAYPLPTAIRFRNRMAEFFPHYHRSRLVVKNLPPAFVLTWKR